MGRTRQHAQRDGGAARAGVVILLGVIVLLLLLGCHWVTYSKLTGGRKACVLTKERIGFSSTFVTAPNELKFAMQNPLIAARLAAGSGMCVDF